VEKGSVGRKSGLLFGDSVCGYSVIKDKDKFVIETFSHRPEDSLKKLNKCLVDAPKRLSIVFIFIKRHI